MGAVGPHTEGAAAAGAPSPLAQGAATTSASGRVFSKATQAESNHRFCSLLRDILCDPWWLSWLLGPMSAVFNLWTERVDSFHDWLKSTSPPSAFPDTLGQIEDEVAQVQVDVVQEEENLEVKHQEAKRLNVKATWTSTTL